MKQEKAGQVHRKAIRKEVPRLRYWQPHGGNSEPSQIIREQFSHELSEKALNPSAAFRGSGIFYNDLKHHTGTLFPTFHYPETRTNRLTGP